MLQEEGPSVKWPNGKSSPPTTALNRSVSPGQCEPANPRGGVKLKRGGRFGGGPM